MSRVNQRMSASDPAVARKRRKLEWGEVDLEGKSIDEWLDEHKHEWTNGGTTSGKKMHQCVHRKCFGCMHSIRRYFNKGLGREVLEKSGEHDHDPSKETRKRGLPFHIKTKVTKLFNDDANYTPKDIHTKIMAEEMNNDLFYQTMITNCIKSLKSQKDYDNKFYKNTSAGIREWASKHVSSNQAQNCDDGNKIIIVKLRTSTNRTEMTLTTKT